MTRRRASSKLMIMDACVLIDFLGANRELLRLIVKHVGQVYVASPVIDEVNDIKDEASCRNSALLSLSRIWQTLLQPAGNRAPHPSRIDCVFLRPKNTA